MWPNELPDRLLVRVLGDGALRLLSPGATRHKEAEWQGLVASEELEAQERLMTDQFSCFWVRFEKEGFRIYLIQELLPLMRFPLKPDLDERVYMQAAPDGDVLIYSIDAYLRHFKN